MSNIIAESQLRTQFFDLVFQDNEGWLCIATTSVDITNKNFRQKFFKWPSDARAIENYILGKERLNNVYFCINLLSKAERKKANCIPTDLVWADLDDVDPTTIVPPPSIVIQSSPNRWQGIWRLTTKLEPSLVENYSKRIAYQYGADHSGWDLTQLLRVPFTYNLKYEDRPKILIPYATEVRAKPLLFEAVPHLNIDVAETTPEEKALAKELPKVVELPDAEKIIYKYSSNLNRTAFGAMYLQEPSEDQDWSKLLWRLIHICLEAEMSPEETFIIVKDAPCNKYARDDRPIEHLWRDILKAHSGQQRLTLIEHKYIPIAMPVLVNEKPDTPNFIDAYKEWAIEATDAVADFHDLSAFMLLSCVISNSVRLETSYGTMVPNIWGMVLGDSTLSRKTTAMRMIIDIMGQLDSEMILATDGSVEGLLTGLEGRPNRTSLFYRDELSGFFEAINKRDYLAGMPEQLTQLYDVPPFFIRRLRKEVIRIENPVFIFFGGGVRDRIYEAINDQYIISGFLPRFLVVSGDTDLTKLRRTGPAHSAGIAKRSAIVETVADLYEHYALETPIKIAGQMINMPPRVTVELTVDAWGTYGDIEQKMLHTANDSSVPNLALPTFERMSRSLLKMAILLAAARQIPVNNRIKVDNNDIKTAAWYVQKWGISSVDLIINAGKRSSEKLLDKIIGAIEKNPGVLRSTLMQHYRLNKREADEVLGTLEDRQLIRRETRGRGQAYWPA